MQRIEINVLTNEKVVIDLTAEEIAEAQARLEQAQLEEANTAPTLQQTLQDQQAIIQSLTTRLTALEAR